MQVLVKEVLVVQEQIHQLILRLLYLTLVVEVVLQDQELKVQEVLVELVEQVVLIQIHQQQ